MDLRELESYRLSDAVKFNDDLNPVLWGSDERLRPEVRDALLKIADDFREFLGIDIEVKDITVSGSNAAYTYTPHSDIDLHLVVDLPKADQSDVYRELFDAKKYAYNDQHDFKIGGYDVELYVQNANQPHHSQGIYSVANDEWIRVPTRRKPEVNDISVRSKYEDIGRRVEAAIESGDRSQMDAIARKIKDMRQAGLDQHGEFGPENLAFKILRGNGTLDKLRQARMSAKDSEMSLEERRKKKSKKKRFAYGNFGGYYFPGYHYYGQTDAASDGGGDGGGGESVKESVESQDIKDVIKMFAGFAAKYLELKKTPKIKLRRDPEWSSRNGTFGRYMPEDDTLILSIANRHPVDVMRTLAHEFVHHRQNEIEVMPDHAGETGSEWEDEANAMAGRIMRDFADAHPGYFDADQVEEGWRDKAGAVAAAACIAGTPGCATLGTDAGRVARDIQTIGRAAQSIERMGTHGAREEIIQRLKNELRRQQGHVVPEDYDPNDKPPGPEFKPTMPAGTVKVDVSDVYDWYKLGQHISDLKGLGKHDFGAGPPSAIISFGDENTEHKYIQGLEKTGLTTTDIDPVDPKQPKGMKRQKTDPTYNVAEASGYIPTAAEKNDPRYSMALTVDVKPGQTGKEANKLGLKTDSQGRPQLLMKKLNNLLESVKTGINIGSVLDLTKNYPTYQVLKARVDSIAPNGKVNMTIIDAVGAGKLKQGQRVSAAANYVQRAPVLAEDQEQDLFEVRMSPSELRRWAASPEAQGIRAGFEAEMIFRNTKRDDDEGEQEPDYDYDERPDSIDHVIDFFSNDDYGYGLTARGARSLREELYNEYTEWVDEQIADDWDQNAEDQVRDFMETHVWGDDSEREDRIRAQVEELFPDDDADEIMAAGNAAPRFTRSSDQTAYVEQNDLYAKYKEAEDAAQENFEVDVASEFESQGEYYDQARENYWDMMRDDGDYDEQEFLRSRYGYMSEIGSSFSLDWPYWTGGSEGSGERDWEDIASSLRNTVGMEVKVGSGYHSTARKDDRWIIEPDGSLDPDDYDDMGLEIVSPPMPLPQALEKLKAVIEWGNDEADAYTNSSTGLHMGVSIPYVGGNVDYVKLILFMGDEYILDKFGRAGNTYTASAMQKLRQNIAGSRNRGELKEAKLDPMGALELVQKNLIELAARYVQDGVGNSKYTSAHIKDGYIEFRSPGGDYLAMANRDEIDDIENTMLRFARAMQIAGSPALERREYAKKLYKLISPGAQDDGLKLFAEYAAGTISPEQLKKQWAEAVLQKEIPNTGKTEYEVFDMNKSKSPDGVIDSFYADSYDQANNMYTKKYSSDPRWNQLDVRIKQPWFDVYGPDGEVEATFRARDIAQATEKAKMDYDEVWTDDWKIYRRPDHTPEPEKKLSQRAQVAQRLKQRPVWWSVEFGGKETLVQARDKAEAKEQAEKQDDFFARNRSYVENIRPATKAEIENWQQQQADNAKDLQQIKARIGEPQPAGQIQNTPAGEWTGRWQVKDTQDRVLYTFTGVGNNQQDANRVALRWLTDNGYGSGTEVEVVPEMR